MIKKFNELFDSEEMKDQVFSENPSAEIDYLRGDVAKYAKVDYDFRTPDIDSLLAKLINFCHPFLKVFIDANETEEGRIEFHDFDVLIRYDQEEEYHAFILASERYMVVLSIKVNEEDYNTYILVDDQQNPDSILSFEENNITFNQLSDIIKEEFIPAIKKYGFEDILNYNFIRNLEAYN